MDILKLLLNSGLGDSTIRSMADKTGLSPDNINDVIAKVAPIFMQKANENFKSDTDSTQLLDIIQKSDLNNTDIQSGNEILSHLTGSKQNSRDLAQSIGSSLNIDSNAIKSLLPMIAPIVAGLLKKQGGGSNGDLLKNLTNFIDQNNDGSIADDVLRIAGNFFGKRG